MKSIEEFLSYLCTLDIKISVKGDRLRCNAPQGKLTLDLQAQLAERKAEILAFLNQGNLVKHPTVKPIRALARDGAIPLSFAQQRLWFLDQLEGGSATYNIPTALHLIGSLQVSTLEIAVQEIVRRHEALRTNFEMVNGSPIQVIHPNRKVNMQVIDLQGLIEVEQSARVRELITQEAERSFNLAHDPLLRVNLLRLEENSHVLLLVMHHIVSDGWSMKVFIRELSALYQSFSKGVPSPLPELLIQYADFTIWQRQWLQGEVLETQLNYWKQHLADAPPLLELPTDRPRPPIQTFRGGIQFFQLDRDFTQKLKRLSQQSGTTLFMTLLAAFVTLLSRYSNQSDIIVGSPIANRNRSEIESLIGFFVNTLVLRIQCAGNPSFEQLLQRVQQVALNAYMHQDVPFEQLVEVLQPERSLSHNPLFQVMFVFQNAPQEKLELPGLTLSPLEVEDFNAKFDLILSFKETKQELTGEWLYNSDLFDATTIERMVRHFQTMLAEIVVDPRQRVSELPLLTEAELHQLLEWNSSQVNYSQNKCIHQLFESQVERTPDAVALVFEDQQLTYRELNTRANQLAHHLQALAVKSEVLVGLCVERSLEMVVGLLGILKAGAAYVPLDPQLPQERLTYMLNDSQVSVLLMQQQWRHLFPEKISTQVVYLDTDWEVISAQSRENLVSNAQPNNLAYVIYTSGSTGKPKGVLINHQNVTRLFTATESWFNFNETDVWTLFHSYAFDFSVWEIWGALLYGGRLVIVPYWISRSPSAFYELLHKERVTVLNQTPSAFRQLMAVEKSAIAASLSSLRLVIFGGEALEPRSLKPWFERHQDQSPKLVNMYGITETTVHVTYRPLTVADVNSEASVIGCPIPDLQVYILDEHLQPVPIGVKGEMYIGGAGLALGYLNRPELTAERFINNPFSQKEGVRLYKTGDLGRYLPDGNIEYLGRIDDQVKIRGFRIELGEIAAVLSQHPKVRETVVIARVDQPDDKHLVAYVVPNQEQPTISELRRFLLELLPEYMVPTAFVVLNAFPLTSNGKIDRRSLPAPNQRRPELESEFVAPYTPEQELLAGVWADVLNLKQVGIYDNFFDLGGDSIRSIQVLAKAKQIGLNFSLPQIFQYQTIYQLSRLVNDELGLSTPKTEAFSLIREGDRTQLPSDIEDAYPLTALQVGMIFHSEYNPESSIYHDVTSQHLRVTFNEQILRTTIQDIADRHPILRTSFDLSNFSEMLQLVHRTVYIPLEVDDLRHLSTTEQKIAFNTWFEAETAKHFDWTCPPLLRFHVHRYTDKTFQLTLSFHHAIFDGWSLAALRTEFWQRYLFLLNQEALTLEPPPATAFRDFVALERLALESQECRQYWVEKLSDINIAKIPRWQACRSPQVEQSNELELSISPEVSDGLKQLARVAGVPLKSVLLAAHLKVLSVLGNQQDVVTGLISNGRPEESDGERILGLFLNTLPFRLNLSGGTWIELVQETFKAEREFLPFRRYPLAELQRILGGQSLFETAFNFVHFHVYQNILGLAGLEELDRKTFQKTNFTLLANFALDLVSSQVKLFLEYESSELCKEQVRAIGNYYTKTLAAMATQHSERYESYSLLSASEQHQLLVEWNDTQVDYPQDKCIHQLFEEQVERTPDAVALVFEDQQLTYRELNTRANQLAHHLQALGVGPEVLVGLCVERSLEMVIGLLGILKAGGAYVPLDPRLPQERLTYMLNDSQVSVLLTQSQLIAGLPDHEMHIVCLDSYWKVICQESGANLFNNANSKNLAYVIYTSGSTGKPKGVAMSHLSLTNLILWQLETAISPAARTLQFAPVSFDVSFQEIFSTCCSGGTLVLLTEEVRRDVVALLKLLLKEAISRLFLPFVALQQLAEVADTSGLIPTSLREIITAGEQLQITPPIASLLRKLTGCILQNHYGPSETHVVSVFTITDLENTGSVLPPIGRPVANTQIYLLDRFLQPVPIGVAGELYIGGRCLARCYVNQPDLTAERFIPNPLSSEKDALLYKTGDLARYLPDGNIEFLGRIDNQVKIRGFRVELGEIEAVLAQHQVVREVVVTAREDQLGNKSLVAYIVPHHKQLLVGELRRFLKQQIPDYMIPSAFMLLETLPLSPNGKVDRKALPVPDIAISGEVSFIAARDTLELQLTQIWEDVLNTHPIGVQHDFFALGGHSLLAVRLMTRIQQQFGKTLPLATLFKSPTIEQLASILRSSIDYRPSSPLVAIQPVGKRSPFFCIHPGGGNVLCYADLARYLGREQPFYGLQSLGLNGEQEPLSRIEDMAACYIETLQSIQPQGPYYLGGWSLGGIIAFEMAQQLYASGHQVALLALIDSYAPIALNKPEEMDEAMLLVSLAKYLGGLFGQQLSVCADKLQQLEPEEQLNYILEQAKILNILSPDVGLQQMHHLFKVFRANLKALYCYTPQPYPNRITLFCANEQVAPVSRDWSNLAGGGVEIHNIPSDHYAIVRKPHVQFLAERLGLYLNQVGDK